MDKANTRYFTSAILLLNLPLFFPYINNDSFTFFAMIAVNMVLAVSLFATPVHGSLISLRVNFSKILPLLIQGSVQLSLYIYVILMNPIVDVRDFWLARMPFLFYQIIFAFVFDYLFSVSRGKSYSPQFYVLPMVLSFNLFLWFIYQYSLIHLPIIILGIIFKNYIVRKGPDGEMHHVFNPSFIVLTICSLLVIALGLNPSNVPPYLVTQEFAYVPPVITSGLALFYDLTPHFSLFVFFVGCFTLWLPNSYLIAIGAYSTLMLLDYLSLLLFGDRLFFGLVRGSVMIAIMLGISDPQTSPRTGCGKFLFGVAYGLCLTFFNFIFAIFSPFDAYFSKILAIPALNIISNRFDSFRYPFSFVISDYYRSRITAIFLFVIIVMITYGQLEYVDHAPTLARVVGDHIRTFFGYAPLSQYFY